MKQDQTKRCTKCYEIKSVALFSADKYTSDGFKSNCKACKKAYREANKEKAAEYNKAYREANKEKLLESQKAYREANKEKIFEYRKAYKAERYKTDPTYRLIHNLRKRLRKALKGNSKSDTTKALIGCSTKFLRNHLESQFTDGMSWDNYGAWHVDHEHPCSEFDMTNPDEQRACFHYSNLQPLWAKENIKKGAKITCEKPIPKPDGYLI